MATTQLPGTVDYRVPDAWFDDFAADFDRDGIDRRVLIELNRSADELVPSTTVHANGQVTVDADLAEHAARIPWRELLDRIDVATIALLHEIERTLP